MKKLNVWESTALSDSYALLAQFKSQIEYISQQSGVPSLYALPPSMVPTAALYQIAMCYQLLYDKVQESDLLNIGAVKTSQQKEMH
jgi:hypothetical protein